MSASNQDDESKNADTLSFTVPYGRQPDPPRDPHSPCTCGSGKSFGQCCAPIILGPYEICPCKSGKKYKFCCYRRHVLWFSFRSRPGEHFKIGEGMQVALVEKQESPLPGFHLMWACNAAKDVNALGASEYHGFIVLLAVATAAEVLVNRLLEPLVEPEKWRGNKGLERKPTAMKWAELSKRLHMTPPLDVGVEPLQSLAELSDHRNAVIHFKHGENIRAMQSAPVDIKPKIRVKRGRPEIHMDIPPMTEKPREQTNETVMDLMPPGRARGYFQVLLNVLNPVLVAYEQREPNLVHSLREVLQANAPDITDRQPAP